MSKEIKFERTESLISKKLTHFFAGGIGACMAVTFTNPFEVVKTRLHLQGELLKRSETKIRPYKNLFQSFSLIYKEEGIKGLQSGLGAAYGYQLIMNGVRFGGYDLLKNNLPKDNFLTPILSASLSGAIGAALGSPLFLVKTRLQSISRGNIPQIGTKYHYKNTWDALNIIYKKEGFKGLYRGNNAAALRTSVGSGVQLPTYDLAKNQLKIHFNFQESTSLHIYSSLISGFLVCCAMNPFDVVTTRTYSQPRDPVTNLPLRYSSISQCFLQILQKEGVYGLFKGFTAHYFRIGPHTILTFVFMEKIKALLV
ncbi:mitochondrial oxaloacetate transport protein [Neoconidiobolus thromboides FSU 785]|nr:mitochondrial oxaloacetate transport protein [Neoconidiobolus thromboides FSU 785]